MSEIDSALAQIAQVNKALRDEVERMRKLYVEEGKKNRILTTKLDQLRATNDILQQRLSDSVPPAPVVKAEEMYSTGDRFVSAYSDEGTQASHLFAQTGFGEVNLIDLLHDGNRFTKPLKVDHHQRVPKHLFDKHFAGENGWQWRKVS